MNGGMWPSQPCQTVFAGINSTSASINSTSASIHSCVCKNSASSTKNGRLHTQRARQADLRPRKSASAATGSCPGNPHTPISAERLWVLQRGSR
eukprot:1898679-Rhodomonas_salina.6